MCFYSKAIFLRTKSKAYFPTFIYFVPAAAAGYEGYHRRSVTTALPSSWLLGGAPGPPACASCPRQPPCAAAASPPIAPRAPAESARRSRVRRPLYSNGRGGCRTEAW
uniref:Uncharacterized protein n=1 Tax=Setaria viridis TaxID=4556 RepID=A0A4U6TA67_SETVI|nr:hypothetical protein SEVIR_8G001925v2 [Setaria viridis]